MAYFQCHVIIITLLLFVVVVIREITSVGAAIMVSVPMYRG